MEFRLLSYRGEKDVPRAGLLVDGDKIMDVERALGLKDKHSHKSHPSTVLAVLEGWDTHLPVLRDIAENSRDFSSAIVGALAETPLAPPILYPPNIYCAAANYLDHNKEMRDGQLPDKTQGRPYFFNKLPRQTVIGPEEPIQLPSPEATVDWEAEVAVVIARPCRNVPASKAMEYAAGFIILNDLSNRARGFRKDWFFKFDWLGGKSFNTSAPIGPWITPLELVKDPHNLKIQLWVNDVQMQNGSSSQMYFTIPEQIEYLSGLFTLLPGDIVSTGTPPGVGHARGIYLKPGDTVTITIEDLGTLKNPVIAGY